MAELEERLTIELALDGFTQAQSLLEGLDLDGLAIEKAEGERRLADLDDLLQQQLVRRTRATDKLDAIGGDSTVARIDAERRTVLLEIEEKAVRYIELKLGVMSAASALRVYRERHRSGMMSEASDALRTDNARPIHRLDDPAGKEHAGWPVQGRRRSVERRPIPALPGSAPRRILRVCQAQALCSLHRR
ncbi:hypothetical protein [Mesorhizobium sp.]|uniref:hypothetical protein n=1 Tax=Mesorhizobium sp. TaxID=1871066 RepID=UPI0025C0E5BF|nr:hypothetical protein [Mesorhizobium sp.]